MIKLDFGHPRITMHKLSVNQVNILLALLKAPATDCSYGQLAKLSSLGKNTVEKEVAKYPQRSTVVPTANTESLEAIGMVRLSVIEEGSGEATYVSLTKRGREFARSIVARRKSFA